MERPFGLPGLCTSDLSAIAELRAREREYFRDGNSGAGNVGSLEADFTRLIPPKKPDGFRLADYTDMKVRQRTKRATAPGPELKRIKP